MTGKQIIEYTPLPVPREDWIREKPAPLLLVTAVEALHKKMMHSLDAEAKEDYLRFFDSYHNEHSIEGTWYADRCVAAIKMRYFAKENVEVVAADATINDIIKANENGAKAHNLGRKQRLLMAKAAQNGEAASNGNGHELHE